MSSYWGEGNKRSDRPKKAAMKRCTEKTFESRDEVIVMVAFLVSDAVVVVVVVVEFGVGGVGGVGGGCVMM
jgi:hypothetical protein